jgi:hypothetical protein
MRETLPERETTSMAAFFRGFLLFFFGAVAGGAGVLFFSPSFNVVVSRGPVAEKPVALAAAPAPAVAPVTPKAAEPVAPVAVAGASTPAPAPIVAAPATAIPDTTAAAEPALDFKSISEHLILWPNSVTVKAATIVPVMANGQKVQDLALEAGAILQLSKVLADGTLEVRAKGAKFEIKSALTDFRVELGKRVSELVAKGTKIDVPFPVAPAAPVAMAAEATPVAIAGGSPATTVVSGVTKAPLTLAQRVDILFGNKPEVAAPTPVVEAAPVAAPVATPASDAKASEKSKDLDRKIDQLFK